MVDTLSSISISPPVLVAGYASDTKLLIAGIRRIRELVSVSFKPRSSELGGKDPAVTLASSPIGWRKKIAAAWCPITPVLVDVDTPTLGVIAVTVRFLPVAMTMWCTTDQVWGCRLIGEAWCTTDQVQALLGKGSRTGTG